MCISYLDTLGAELVVRDYQDASWVKLEGSRSGSGRLMGKTTRQEGGRYLKYRIGLVATLNITQAVRVFPVVHSEAPL